MSNLGMQAILSSVGIGQGYWTATPIQLAKATDYCR